MANLTARLRNALRRLLGLPTRSEYLGEAVLVLKCDTSQLDAALDRAERRLAAIERRRWLRGPGLRGSGFR